MLMDSSFFLTTLAATTIGFFTLFRKFRIRQENKDAGSSLTSPPSLLSSSTSHPSSLSCNWTHHVFPSFRGEDVRRNFLSHIQKEFRRKGITPFIDNEIKRGESIGPELIKAIKTSKIAIVLLSKNYASSKWCLDELVEIMKCKKELGQTVLVIFYEVDPSHVKKLTGEFGAVFEKTCKGKTTEDIWRWRQAFKEVATIAGYDSRNWENEAVMIEEIVTEISKILISTKPSSDFEGLVGMGAHMEKMKELLCLGSADERRTVGISGPSGIGKTTIARVLYNQISNGFQLSVFMKFKPSYARPTCSDDHDVKLQLEQQLLSQLINQDDIKIHHLGTAEHFLMGKKVLIVLDGVDQSVQLLAMPKVVCLGPGSRIIITTQDQRLLKAFQIKDIYNVDFPSDDEALQIFCMHAFGQSSPYDSFKELATKVTRISGNLPLGLRVMGSYFRGMSKEEWKRELPRLKIRLDGEIGSILKFSYDALDDEDKDLFLYIACFFNDEGIDHTFEDTVRHKFLDVRQGLRVLVQRSLISEEKSSPMHNLLVQLGREIVRSQSIYEPRKRQFLVDAKEICEVLNDDTGSKSVIGINLNFSRNVDELSISERAFEDISNLQFLRFHNGVGYSHQRLHLPQGLNYLPPKLRILHWDDYPMKCLPSRFNPKFLVKIIMNFSKLEKLWEGIQPLINLKVMDLDYSTNLKELPDLSMTTSLLKLNLVKCFSLVEVPSSIGNATNLQRLDLRICSSLVKLPSSIGNIVNLKELELRGCSSLMELPSSIGNIVNLRKFDLSGCSSLVELPHSIGNMINLLILDLSLCLSLVQIPSSIGNIITIRRLDISRCSMKLPSSIENMVNLRKLVFSACSSLVEVPSFIGKMFNLQELGLSGCSGLVELPFSIGNATNLQSLNLTNCSSLVKLPSSIGNIFNLQKLDLMGCLSLVELPFSIGNFINLWKLNLSGCSSLMRIPSSIGNIVNLRNLDISECSSLVGLPFSIGNIYNLREFYIHDCSSLVELPSSIWNIINLDELYLSGCSSLVKLPSFNGKVVHLKELDLNGCSSLVEISCSIGNLCMLTKLSLQGCSKVEALPINIILDSLEELDVTGCSQLTKFPEISKNIKRLMLCGTLVKEVPLSIKSWSRLRDLRITYCKDLEKFPHVLDKITELELNDTELEEVPAWINGISRLRRLVLNKCTKLVSLSQLPRSLLELHAENCESLERLACPFSNYKVCLKFIDCWKLNEKGRDIIIQTSTSGYTILPSREMPAFFTYRANNGESLVVKLDQRLLHTSLRFKVCILLVKKRNKADYEECVVVNLTIVDKQSGRKYMSKNLFLRPVLTEHLYTFEGEVKNVESIELSFKINVQSYRWKIGEWGIRSVKPRPDRPVDPVNPRS